MAPLESATGYTSTSISSSAGVRYNAGIVGWHMPALRGGHLCMCIALTPCNCQWCIELDWKKGQAAHAVYTVLLLRQPDVASKLSHDIKSKFFRHYSHGMIQRRNMNYCCHDTHTTHPINKHLISRAFYTSSQFSRVGSERLTQPDPTREI